MSKKCPILQLNMFEQKKINFFNQITFFVQHNFYFTLFWIATNQYNDMYFLGIRVSYQNIYLSIFVSITSMMYGIAWIFATVKQVKERRKELKLQKNIQHISETVSQPILQFNNVKYNIPLLTGPQMALFGKVSLH